MAWQQASVGTVVSLSTCDGDYQGVVVVNAASRLLLKKVQSRGKQFHGTQCFYASDILEGHIIKTKNGQTADASSINDENSSSERPAPCNLSKQTLEDVATKAKRKFETMERVFVDEETLDAVIRHIGEQTQIGLAIEGVNVSRNGCLCWLQVATDGYIFFFHMFHHATAFFQGGLKAVLEDSGIVKIVHDCRWMSDCFRNCYDVSLNNVFDTQVADLLAYKLFNNGKILHHVKSLPVCLMEHLHFGKADVHFPENRLSGGDPMWKQDPLPADLIAAAEKNVAYLTDLMHVLDKKLRLELDCATEMYLAAVRDAPNHEVAVMSSGELPPSFLTNHQSACRKRIDETMRDWYGNADLVERITFVSNSTTLKTSSNPFRKTQRSIDEWHRRSPRDIDTDQHTCNILPKGVQIDGDESNLTNGVAHLRTSDQTSSIDTIRRRYLRDGAADAELTQPSEDDVAGMENNATCAGLVPWDSVIPERGSTTNPRTANLAPAGLGQSCNISKRVEMNAVIWS